MSTIPAQPFQVDHFHKYSLLDCFKRHWSLYDLSLSHAISCLILNIFALALSAPTWNVSEWFTPSTGFIHQPTPPLVAIAFLYSCGYYAWDTFCIFHLAKQYNNGKFVIDDYGYIFHHFACSLGMFFPAILGVDGTLVAIGFILGEISNPPRGFASLLNTEREAMHLALEEPLFIEKYLTPYNLDQSHFYERYRDIFIQELHYIDIHFYSYVLLRFVLIYYTFFQVLPHSRLSLTFIAAFCMTIFTVISLVMLFMQRSAIKREVDPPEVFWSRFHSNKSSQQIDADNVSNKQNINDRLKNE